MADSYSPDSHYLCTTMKRTDLSWNPNYFDTYINKVDDIELAEALQKSIADLDALDVAHLHRIGDQVYAPGKWTIRDILQHVLDTERVFAYRALRFARNDKTALPGYDENSFAENANASQRPLEAIIAEMKLTRQSSMMMFNSFSDEALRRTGVAFNAELPVLALGFILVGHQNHHFGVMEERYFSLVP